jgi:fatty-acyl-CoA synthase
LSSLHLGQLFEEQARAQSGREFLVSADRRLTYGQVAAQVRALAAAFQGLGISAGDRVAINLPNWIEWVVSALACARLGVTIVPVDPGLSFHELKYQLRHSEVAAVVTAESFGGTDYMDLFDELLPDLPDLHFLVTVGKEELWHDDRVFQFEDLVAREPSGHLPPTGDDPATLPLALLYTSGTMGKPKGVVLSHQAIVETARLTSEVERRELETALGRAIAELPEDRRIVVVLRDLEGLPYEEIAQVLELELGTVRSRLHRARAELKEKLERFLP